MKQKKYTVISDSGLDIDGQHIVWYPIMDEDGSLYDWTTELHKDTPTFFSRRCVEQFYSELSKIATHVQLEIVRIEVPDRF